MKIYLALIFSLLSFSSFAQEVSEKPFMPDTCISTCGKPIVQDESQEQNIYFAKNKYTFTDASTKTLEQLLQYINEKNIIKVSINVTAYANPNSDTYNMAIASKRATSVKRFFEMYGVSSEIITTQTVPYQKVLTKCPDANCIAKLDRVQIFAVRKIELKLN